MRGLIAKIYRFLYQITGSQYLSLALAIIYISALNLLTVYGLASLVTEWLPSEPLLHLFMFPFVWGLAVVMMVINLAIMMPLNGLFREKHSRTTYAPVLLYSAIALVLYIYTHFADSIFS